MSSCFPLFSKFKIPKILTSLSAIGTLFCFKKGGYEQSSTSQESSTNSSNNSPTNNGDEEAINSSQLSGANTQNGGESHSDSSSSSSMISISPESSDCNIFSRTTSPELLEPSSEFTPVDPSPPRIARGVSRSDAREGPKSPLRFTSAPEFSSKFPIDNSENNEGLEGKAFIQHYIVRKINEMESRNPTGEDKPSQKLSGSQTLDLPDKIMKGRDTTGINALSIPPVVTRPNLTEGETAGLGMRPSFTWVMDVAKDAALESARRVKEGRSKGGMTF